MAMCHNDASTGLGHIELIASEISFKVADKQVIKWHIINQASGSGTIRMTGPLSKMRYYHIII